MNGSDSNFNTDVIKPVEVFREAWAMVKSDYPLLFVITIVGALIGGVVPIILTAPMVCGIYLCYLDKYDGRELKFDGLFKGFQFFGPALIVFLAILVPLLIVFAVIYLPLFLAAIHGREMSESELWNFIVVTVATEAVAAFVMVCFHTLLFFAIPLVVDRGSSGFGSLFLSIKAVWANLSGVVGLMALSMLVAIAGYLMLCIGIYFVMPILIAMTVVAYRKVFPEIIV